MPNISNQIRINAFKYVEENNTAALSKLIAENPDLVNVRSQRDNSTLFIRSCEYISKDIVELLLNKGADPLAINNHGNNGIMHLFYRHNPQISDVNKHDYQAIKILELLKEKNISLNCFIAQDADKDTPLIEAGRARLLECSKFIVELLKEQNLLQEQFSHQNNKGQDIIQVVTSEEFLDKMLNEEKKIYSSFEMAKFHIDDAIKVSSPTSQEKDKLLSLVKEDLLKLSSEQIANLACTIFQEKLYNQSVGADSTYHSKNLQKEYASGNFGVKIFNSIDVGLIELLYVAGGINLNKHIGFINSLSSLKDTEVNKNGMCSAVILESNKQKILQIIKSSDTLSKCVQGASLELDDKDIVTVKDFALKRFCFLAANKENLEINKNSEAGILLNFANWANISIGYEFKNNFEKYLLEECRNFDHLKEILKICGQNINAIIKDSQIVSNLIKLESDFQDNTALLASNITLLLNTNLPQEVLTQNLFLSLINSTTGTNIDKKDQELMQNNLKFFTDSSTFKVPEYDKLDQEKLNNSIAYYKNNQDALISNLVLLKIANDEVKLSKIKDILNSHYIKAKSMVGACLNVILDGWKYLKSLEIAGLDASLDEQNLVDKLPVLKTKINKVLKVDEVECIKNTTSLCKQVNKFLNISPITSIFEEYDNNYQILELEVNNLGELGIEWNLS